MPTQALVPLDDGASRAPGVESGSAVSNSTSTSTSTSTSGNRRGRDEYEKSTDNTGGICECDGLVWEYIDESESDFIYHEVFNKKQYSKHLAESDVDTIRTVVDVGANIGLFSMYCKEAFPNLSCMVAVEPVPPIHEVLQRNLRAGKFSAQQEPPYKREEREQQDGVTYLPSMPGESTRNAGEQRRRYETLCALARVTDIEEIRDLEAPSPGDLSGETLSCVVHSLDNILTRHLGSSTSLTIDLLKVDVEGDELKVLNGVGDAWWPRITRVIVEVHDIENRLHGITDVLKGKGYNEIVIEQQVTEVDEDTGYISFVPKEIEMYMVYASRSMSES
jgi:FkbM family methyltransferase